MSTASPFHGLSAFPLTPADADGRVDTEALAALIDRLVVDGVTSITVLGSTGTYAYLTRQERRRAVAAAREALAGRLPLIVGVGALRTSWAQQLAREAEGEGADALLLAPVSYTPLTADEVSLHYETVASATGLPLCIYNNPSTTNFVFSAELIAKLSRIPNIAAVKMPIPLKDDFQGEIKQLRNLGEPDLAIGYSGDWGAAPALLAGADAWYSVIAGLLPGPAARLAKAALRGDVAEATRLDRAFEPLWDLFRAHGSLRVMYAMGDLLGLGIGEPPLPIRPLARSILGELGDSLRVIGAG